MFLLFTLQYPLPTPAGYPKELEPQDPVLPDHPLLSLFLLLPMRDLPALPIEVDFYLPDLHYLPVLVYLRLILAYKLLVTKRITRHTIGYVS